jgi:hypothetical protein
VTLQETAVNVPLQSIERLDELDLVRHRPESLRLCGWLGLQSIMKPAGSVSWVRHALFVLLLADAP